MTKESGTQLCLAFSGSCASQPPCKFQPKRFAPGSWSESVCKVGTVPGYPDSLFPTLTTALLTGYLVMQISLHNILSAMFCHEKIVTPNSTWKQIEIVSPSSSIYSMLQMTHPTVRSYYNQIFVVKGLRWNDAVLIKWPDVCTWKMRHTALSIRPQVLHFLFGVSSKVKWHHFSCWENSF